MDHIYLIDVQCPQCEEFAMDQLVMRCSECGFDALESLMLA